MSESSSMSLPKFVKLCMSPSVRGDVKPECFFEMVVRREYLLLDVLSQLRDVIVSDMSVLRLPLRWVGL